MNLQDNVDELLELIAYQALKMDMGLKYLRYGEVNWENGLHEIVFGFNSGHTGYIEFSLRKIKDADSDCVEICNTYGLPDFNLKEINLNG